MPDNTNEVREAYYRELTGRGLPDHELIAGLDRAEAALAQQDQVTSGVGEAVRAAVNGLQRYERAEDNFGGYMKECSQGYWVRLPDLRAALGLDCASPEPQQEVDGQAAKAVVLSPAEAAALLPEITEPRRGLDPNELMALQDAAEGKIRAAFGWPPLPTEEDSEPATSPSEQGGHATRIDPSMEQIGFVARCSCGWSSPCGSENDGALSVRIHLAEQGGEVAK